MKLEIESGMEILRKIIAISKTLYKAAGVGSGAGIIIARASPSNIP